MACGRSHWIGRRMAQAASAAEPGARKRPAQGGPFFIVGAGGLLLDDGLLRHDLLRRLDHALPAGGGSRGRRGLTGGGRPAGTALAVAGVVALALEGLAVALAHRMLLICR